MRLFPDISIGLEIFIKFKIVGAMSESIPLESSNFSLLQIIKGTGFKL